MSSTNAQTNLSQATGPKTAEGKQVASRNATSHGLFAREVVLPHLGEDPAGYKALREALTEQFQPQDTLEQHYVEKIAAASWRLKRLQRWQRQLLDDPEINEDQVLAKLEKLMRYETNLCRQIDTSVKMLARDLPQLLKDRVRALQTQICKNEPPVTDSSRTPPLSGAGGSGTLGHRGSLTPTLDTLMGVTGSQGRGSSLKKDHFPVIRLCPDKTLAR
jgi:hypothetical protein